MSLTEVDRATLFDAEIYDDSVSDWAGEIEFYQELAAQARQVGGPILELGCGTGRVALRLARGNVPVVGLDRSRPMLDVARRKSHGAAHLRWVEGNMRSFDLGQRFALVLIPGHAFQCLNSTRDQLECLACVRRHLMPAAQLVVHLDHQDVTWLAGIAGRKVGEFEKAGHFRRSATGREIQAYRSWSYEPATQTAVSQTRWEEIDADGRVVDTWQKQPVRLHCVFPFEMEHLLARAGFEVQAVFGDFHRHPLTDSSPEMIWVAKRAGPAG